jgi:membrane protease YdiL (CAAX protease family)
MATFWRYVGFAYAWSWAFWGLAMALGLDGLGGVAYYLAGFGPFLAALAMVALAGRPVGSWLLGLLKWRVAPGWYAFALGFPIALASALALILLALGFDVRLAGLGERLTAYLPTLAMMALIGGGNEEPGWRGFALPILQDRMGALRATLLLGLIWALWHLPLLGLTGAQLMAVLSPVELAALIALTLVSIAVHAFWYTWLINRTGSVLLCILLHASYNTANGLIVAAPEVAMTGAAYLVPLALMTGLLSLTVIALLIATHGRLGRG